MSTPGRRPDTALRSESAEDTARTVAALERIKEQLIDTRRMLDAYVEPLSGAPGPDLVSRAPGPTTSPAGPPELWPAAAARPPGRGRGSR